MNFNPENCQMDQNQAWTQQQMQEAGQYNPSNHHTGIYSTGYPQQMQEPNYPNQVQLYLY